VRTGELSAATPRRAAVLVIGALALTSAAVQPAAAPAGASPTVTESYAIFDADRDLFPTDGTTPTPAPTPTLDPRLGSSTSFKVYKAADGTVIRWDPCRPIHYRVNLLLAPVGALTDVKRAIYRLEIATGLDFVYDGTTSVFPQRTYGAGSSPTDPPPVVIAWARRGTGSQASNILGGEAYAVGGWRGIGWTDATGVHPMRAVTGEVVVDVVSNNLPAGFATTTGGTRGALLLHELGHVVGLQHVSDATQEMNPYLISRASYGNGDRTGLARVGAAAGCLP